MKPVDKLMEDAINIAELGLCPWTVLLKGLGFRCGHYKTVNLRMPVSSESCTRDDWDMCPCGKGDVRVQMAGGPKKAR